MSFLKKIYFWWTNRLFWTFFWFHGRKISIFGKNMRFFWKKWKKPAFWCSFRLLFDALFCLLFAPCSLFCKKNEKSMLFAPWAKNQGVLLLKSKKTETWVRSNIPKPLMTMRLVVVRVVMRSWLLWFQPHVVESVVESFADFSFVILSQKNTFLEGNIIVQKCTECTESKTRALIFAC